MMIRSFVAALGLMALSPFAVSALEAAKYVVAAEITGLVLEAETGKPIPGAVVAIRFERNNTGHSGVHCFRSMAVEADAEGRFRFSPWTQESTRANATYGVVTAYKVGYSEPSRPAYVKQSRRSVAGIAFSDTIKIPKTDVRLELPAFTGTEAERIEELRRLVANFACRSRAEFEDTILLTRVREEIVGAPYANQKPRTGSYTALEWIDQVIKRDNRQK